MSLFVEHFPLLYHSIITLRANPLPLSVSDMIFERYDIGDGDP